MQNLISAEIIAEAQSLYDAGFNVFPIQYVSKDPYGSTSLLTITRIHSSMMEALFTGSNIGVMAGRLSRNLFVLACDTDESFEEIGAQLRKRNIKAWVRLGVDGGQYWLLCAEGEVRNENFGDMQVLGNRQYTVAPPSVHPEGVFYHWTQKDGDLPPMVSVKDMAFLHLSLASDQRRDFKRDKTTLPPVAYRVLVEGNIADYASNSEAEFAACASLISKGMPDTMIRQVFATSQPPHYMKSRGRSFDKYTLARAHRWVTRKRAEEADTDEKFEWPHSSQFASYAGSRPWPGRTGNTDKAVYLACCKRMQMDKGSRVFRASMRELSELANVGTQAVLASIGRLKVAGLVKYEKRDEVSNASLYSLIVQEKMTVTTTVGFAYIPVGDSVVINAIQEDAFHTKALGKSACSIWQLLLACGKSLTVKQITESSGRVTSTVTTNLTKLEALGLVHKVNNGTPTQWTGCDASVDRLREIAMDLGTAGKAAKRKMMHLEERQKRVSNVLMEQKRRFLLRYRGR